MERARQSRSGRSSGQGTRMGIGGGFFIGTSRRSWSWIISSMCGRWWDGLFVWLRRGTLHGINSSFFFPIPSGISLLYRAVSLVWTSQSTKCKSLRKSTNGYSPREGGNRWKVMAYPAYIPEYNCEEPIVLILLLYKSKINEERDDDFAFLIFLKFMILLPLHPDNILKYWLVEFIYFFNQIWFKI